MYLADPNIEDGYGNLPIHYASEALTVEDFKTLVELLREWYVIINCCSEGSGRSSKIFGGGGGGGGVPRPPSALVICM